MHSALYFNLPDSIEGKNFSFLNLVTGSNSQIWREDLGTNLLLGTQCLQNVKLIFCLDNVDKRQLTQLYDGIDAEPSEQVKVLHIKDCFQSIEPSFICSPSFDVDTGFALKQLARHLGCGALFHAKNFYDFETNTARKQLLAPLDLFDESPYHADDESGYDSPHSSTQYNGEWTVSKLANEPSSSTASTYGLGAGRKNFTYDSEEMDSDESLPELVDAVEPAQEPQPNVLVKDDKSTENFDPLADLDLSSISVESMKEFAKYLEDEATAAATTFVQVEQQQPPSQGLIDLYCYEIISDDEM